MLSRASRSTGKRRDERRFSTIAPTQPRWLLQPFSICLNQHHPFHLLSTHIQASLLRPALALAIPEVASDNAHTATAPAVALAWHRNPLDHTCVLSTLSEQKVWKGTAGQ
ncbi:hypothetical protein MMC10_001640 [Thelotrema lepadinum]|nr:hypothetical protein [Thelotrema lepadinum]